MKTLFIGQYCIKLDKTDSTNSYLSELLVKSSLAEGSIVIAGNQEKGKGQRGTGWESEQGKNITLSVLLKPAFLAPDEQFELSKAVALSVADFIRENIRHAEIKIKWPNDIYIDNKKVAGILIENSVSGNSISHSVIGIGININQESFSKELPNPSSLKLAAGKEFDLEECLERLCSCIEKRYLQLRSDPEEIGCDYLGCLYRFDKWAFYNFKGEKLIARIMGVSKTGKLILERKNKERLECDIKEVEF